MIHYFSDLKPINMVYIAGSAEVSGPGVDDVRLLEITYDRYDCPNMLPTLTPEELQAVKTIVRDAIDHPEKYEYDPCFYGC